MDEKFFTVIVGLKEEQDNGRVRNYTEKYLVKAITYADVEAKVAKEFEGLAIGEFSIKKISDDKILKVIE